MKRFFTTFVVVLFVLATACAQKQSSNRSSRTSYKFKFEHAIDLDTKEEVDCDISIELLDRQGGKPSMRMLNSLNGETQEEPLKPGINVVQLSSGEEMILFYSEDGVTTCALTMQQLNTGGRGCVLVIKDVYDEKTPEEQYMAVNKPDSPNAEQCALAYDALMKTAKANSFNNYTVQIIK